MRSSRLCRRQPRGTSTLEMVVVLPTLLFLMFGIVELSRAWMTLNVVTQAAREGARVGSVTDPFDPAPAIARIRNVLSGANLLPDLGTASVTCAAPCGPDAQVTASVTVNFQTIFPLLLPMLSGPMPLTNTAVMRFE